MKFRFTYIILSLLISFSTLGQSTFNQRELAKWNVLINDFKNSDNPVSFCKINSDHTFIVDTLYYSYNNRLNYLNVPIQDSIQNKKENTVVGPFRSNAINATQYIDFIFRIKKIDSCYKIRASHILLKCENESDFTKQNILADKIITKIKNGESFKKMALKYGSDGTATYGGDLGWFEEGMMVKPFNDACFKAKKDDLFKIETPFGIHIVKITENKVKNIRSYIILPIIKNSPKN
jgi:hypothetical protein